MKKTIIYTLIIFAMSFSSCDEWLDISPKAEIKSEDMFSNQNGFRDALTGVYSIMTTSSLYGTNLSFGLVDVLPQYYNRIRTSTHDLYHAVNFNYEDAATKNMIDAIWGHQYKAIVNLNAMLEFIDDKQNIFAPSVYEVYKGEVLGLRALLHFDLLRLFAPSPALGNDLKAIPFMNEYTNIAKEQLTVGEIIEKIVSDLNTARDLMRDNDPYGPNREVILAGNVDDLLNNRNFHLNYYAVTALMARVQLYAGNNNEALIAANELINSADKNPVSPFLLTSAANENDKLFLSEVLFSLNIPKLADMFDPYFGVKAGENNSSTLLAMNTSRTTRMYKTTNPSDDDFRFKLWFQLTSKSFENMLAKYDNATEIPLIRLSEIYLIAAECSENDADGLAYLNKIRSHRGLAPLLSTPNLQEEIKNEYIKEFIGEGQMYFYYKRKNLTVMGVNTTKTVIPDVDYIFPFPVDELDFGNLTNN